MASSEEGIGEWQRVCLHYRTEMTDAQYLILCLLAGHGGTASRRTFDVGFSSRSVDNALKELVEQGVIKRTKKGVYKLDLD